MKKKKAFTIVELIIVIAVIGILAAILIPTFTNVITKAKHANDVQLATELNKMLIISRDGGENSVQLDRFLADVVNMGISDFTTKVEDTRLVWDMGNDVVLYVDKDNNVINRDSGFVTDKQLWYNLTPGVMTIVSEVEGESVDFDDLFH